MGGWKRRGAVRAQEPPADGLVVGFLRDEAGGAVVPGNAVRLCDFGPGLKQFPGAASGARRGLGRFGYAPRNRRRSFLNMGQAPDYQRAASAYAKSCDGGFAAA